MDRRWLCRGRLVGLPGVAGVVVAAGSQEPADDDLQREAGIDVYAPISGWVRLAIGETVKSSRGSRARGIEAFRWELASS